MTACDTSGLVPSEILDAEVKARVPQSERDRVEKEAKERRRSGARISSADILREALKEYFDARKDGNGKAPKRAKRELANA